jgi:hypothetical protein
MARSRFLLITTISVAFACVGAWYPLERAERVATPIPSAVAIASAVNLPLLTGPGRRSRSASIAVPGVRREERSC